MPVLVIPLDGRLTSQNVLTGTLDGTAVIPIVSPGNVTSGNSYQVTLNTLSTFFASSATLSPTIITSGPTYASVATDFRILVDLTVSGVLTITMLPSSNYTRPILIKDIKGNVDAINTVTTNFSGGQLADGLSTIVLSNAYAGFVLNPLVAGGFYITAA